MTLTASLLAHVVILVTLIGLSLEARPPRIWEPVRIVTLATLPAPPPQPASAPAKARTPVRTATASIEPVVPAPPVPHTPSIEPVSNPGVDTSLFPSLSIHVGVTGDGSGVPGGLPGISAGAITGPLGAPPPPRGPVRVGGDIKAPALVNAVPPVYPTTARLANVHGDVVVEATVAADGHVESVRVLKSVKLLDDAALAAVRQWVYSPLRLNDTAVPFVLAVTISFNVKM